MKKKKLKKLIKENHNKSEISIKNQQHFFKNPTKNVEDFFLIKKNAYKKKYLK